MGSSWHTRAFGIVLVAVANRAHAETATFALASGESKVQFVSDAPLERITGATTRVNGQIEFDPAAPAGVRAEIAVPVASIKTNNDLRDEHLRSDDWLDAKRFPNVVFTLAGVSGLSALPLDQSTSANVRGKLSVHGITRELATTAKVRLSQAEGKRTLRVQAQFPVSLEAHEVSVPSLVKLKVAPVIQVHLDLYAHAPLASTREQPAAAPTGATGETSAAPTRPVEKATPASKPAKSGTKARSQANDAGASEHPPAADEPSKLELVDASQPEASRHEGTGATAPAAPSTEPSASAAPATTPTRTEDAAPQSREQGCNAISSTYGAWPLLLAAVWRLRRRRGA